MLLIPPHMSKFRGALLSSYDQKVFHLLLLQPEKAAVGWNSYTDIAKEETHVEKLCWNPKA